MPSPNRLLRYWTSPQARTFLAVGGAGYVVDVATFNVLRSSFANVFLDPTTARVLAAAAAMAVTYVGNRALTWRDTVGRDRRHEVALFVVFSVIGLCFSVATLMISHDLLGLTSRLADNISANVVGLGLGTIFRFWTYQRFVFAPNDHQSRDEDRAILVRS
ncbi:GtrA family protein [Aeromicrobium sp.]|uniref:GtrA family protein n=1 Tax=Aeromicrobium sp. TaxID=1871063 RepID=UPI003C651FB9